MKLVPDGFAVPTSVRDGEWHLEALTIHHVDRDFVCFLENREHLVKRMNQIEPDWDWPANLTLEDDLTEMAWHQGEFKRRTSFAYMLLTEEGTRSVGCVYLLPAAPPYQVRVDFWVTAASFDAGLERQLVSFLGRWLDEVWQFDRIQWPRRYSNSTTLGDRTSGVNTLVPAGYPVPSVVRDAGWHLEVMTLRHVLRDFQCFLENREHLEVGMKRYETDWEWVWPPGLTLEEDVVEMGWCHGSFRRRSAFCYMLLADDGSRSLGCVYLFPTDEPHDVRLEFWVTEKAFTDGLESDLAEFLRRWLSETWPFERVRWPERHR